MKKSTKETMNKYHVWVIAIIGVAVFMTFCAYGLKNYFDYMVKSTMQTEKDILFEEFKDDYVESNLFHTIPTDDQVLLRDLGMDWANSCDIINHTYICSDRNFIYEVDLKDGVFCKIIIKNGRTQTINDWFYDIFQPLGMIED